MDLQSYIVSKQNKKPNAEIAERWQNRIVAQGLEKMGEAGAQQYLNLYGKGIAAPKCILMAIQAEICGFPQVAQGFWKKAYELETGNSAAGQSGKTTVSASQKFQMPESIHDENFPPSLQPGKFATMQPSDGRFSRERYINNPYYWGQPKRDGNKVVVFATANKVYYQSRSLKLRACPNAEMDNVLKEVARLTGSFVVEGELYFLDYLGKEHRTGAQAAGVNIEAGHGDIQVETRYMIFYAICLRGQDLRDQSYEIRILYGENLARDLQRLSPIFEQAITARTCEEKKALSERQLAEGREGEVWFQSGMLYRAGKNTEDKIVRTKYLVELNAIVTGLTPTTAQDRPFGAIEVSDMNGKPIGSIGTGFTKVDALKIWTRFHSGKQLVIPIITQGYTENGQVMHGRLSEEFE